MAAVSLEDKRTAVKRRSEKTRGGTETDIEKISVRVDFVFFVQSVDVLVQLHQDDANQQNSGDEVALVKRVCLICLQNL